MKTRMNRLKFLFITSILLITGVYVKAQQEVRTINNFSRVEFSLSGSLEIVQGASNRLEIIASKTDLENILTIVESNKLKIYCKDENYRLGKVIVKLQAKEMNNLELSGSGDIIVKSELKTNDLEIMVSGSGDIEILRLSSTNIKALINGSGNILLGGTVAEKLELVISGSGMVSAEGLISKEANVIITGSGTVKVNTSEKLKATITGSGNVFYLGKPLIDAEVSGSGKTQPLK